MFVRLWRYLFCHRGSSSEELTCPDLDDSPYFTFDWESFITEGGEIVGATATINVDDEKLYQTSSWLPSGFMPSFQARKNQILFAGKHVARLRAVELLPDGTCQTISAAHNVIPRTDGGRIIKIGFAYMGRSIVDCNTPTNECIVTALHYAHKSMSQDIAILKCPRHYAPTFLSLSADPLGKGDVVHVIGYPGEISSDWLKDAHDSLNDLQTSLCRSEVLLPKDTLTVTEGIMESMQDGKLSYRISTSHGMSGSPVLYNGKVHGIHVGHRPNIAILFSDPEVRAFLRRQNVMDVVT